MIIQTIEGYSKKFQVPLSAWEYLQGRLVTFGRTRCQLNPDYNSSNARTKTEQDEFNILSVGIQVPTMVSDSRLLRWRNYHLIRRFLLCPGAPFRFRRYMICHICIQFCSLEPKLSSSSSYLFDNHFLLFVMDDQSRVIKIHPLGPALWQIQGFYIQL